MNTAAQAKMYREDGKYLLALSCAQLGSDPASKAEESLALCWLGHIQRAESCARDVWEKHKAQLAPTIKLQILLAWTSSLIHHRAEPLT